MDLYWGSGSPYAWRVMLALLIKDLPYEDHLLSFERREHKQLGYTTLNPRGKVPTLVDGDVVVTESIAILAYLDRAYPEPPLFGEDPAQAGRIWRKVMEIENYLLAVGQPVIRALFFQRWRADQAELRERVADLLVELDRQEQDAERGPLNAVDCMLAPTLASVRRASMKSGAEELGLLPLDWRRWSRLVARYEQLKALDGFQRTVPPHWRT